MEYKNIKVYASVCDHSTVYEVNVAIPMETWERNVDNLADVVEVDIVNYIFGLEDEDYDYAEHFKDSTGYIDTFYGHVHDCSPDQTRIAFHLDASGVSVDRFLEDCDALGIFRDAFVKELETNHPEKSAEINALKSIVDLEKGMLTWYDNDDRLLEDEDWICHIYCEYPLELLDDIDRKMRQNNPQYPHVLLP